MHVEHRRCTGRGERWPTRDGFEQDHAEGIEVRAAVYIGRALRLLRTHVFLGTDDEPAPRHAVVARARDRASDTQVEEDRALRRGCEHNVVRLDVTVRNPVRVGVLQCLEDVRGDRDRARDREAGLALQRLAERVPRQVRHHVPEEIVRFTAVHHPGDVRVIELRRVADFAQEAVGGHRDGQLGVQHFDGDMGAACVLGRENGRVPASTHRTEHGVTVAQGLADPLNQVACRHSVPSPRRSPGGTELTIGPCPGRARLPSFIEA